MKTVVITGSSGLIGSEAVRFFHAQGFQIVGIDNDMRRIFFGPEASTQWNLEELKKECGHFVNYDVDIRDAKAVTRIFTEHGKDIVLTIHAAAQPSHDWAAQDPVTDFGVNALGTLNLLEAARAHCPNAVFIFTSTNKVYGDHPNRLPLVELETRWEIDPVHPYYPKGIDETMPLDRCKHSLFGASKLAADILVQEYGFYFGMKTGVFRGGCLTGPRHSGAEMHGFLAYLMKCAVLGRPYHILGYKGKQVRDNIHSYDMVNSFYHFFRNPRRGEAYNMGGSRFSNCSILEAIGVCEKITGQKMKVVYKEQNRAGDHIWWISDVSKFKAQYPEWGLTKTIEDSLRESYTYNKTRWGSLAK